MDQGVLYFQRIRPDLDLMNEIFGYDARTLPQTDSSKISQYCIALSQYVVYLQSEMNKTKSEINMKKRFIDSTVNMILTPSMIKEHKSKAAATEFIVSNSQPCLTARDEIGLLNDELILVEGQDRNLLELVNAFKRELTRKDNELYATRTERR